MSLSKSINTFLVRIIFGKKYLKELASSQSDKTHSADAVKGFMKLGFEELKKEIKKTV